mgnify:CR=1 FL=1
MSSKWLHNIQSYRSPATQLPMMTHVRQYITSMMNKKISCGSSIQSCFFIRSANQSFNRTANQTSQLSRSLSRSQDAINSGKSYETFQVKIRFNMLRNLESTCQQVSDHDAFFNMFWLDRLILLDFLQQWCIS